MTTETKPGWTYCTQCAMDIPTPIFMQFCITTTPEEDE